MLSKTSQSVRDGVVRDTLDKTFSIASKRTGWEQAVLKLPLPADIRLETDLISGVPCTWVHNGLSTGNELIVYIHGGGMVEGSAITHQEYAARLAMACGMNILLIDYRLSPEHIFPAARNDVSAVLNAIDKMNSPPMKITVGGESSGAGLLVSALVSRRDSGSAMPAKMFLMSGVYDLTFSGPSIHGLSVVDPFTSIDVLQYYAELYAPHMMKNDPGLSPLFADHSGLPDTLMMVGSDEILLSDSESMASAMARQGVDVRLEVWPDMWHVWPMYPDLPEADKALEKIAEFLKAE